MIPKGPLGRRLLDNLSIYDGTEHKHERRQKPRNIPFQKGWYPS